jgi:hypothetical protein
VEDFSSLSYVEVSSPIFYFLLAMLVVNPLSYFCALLGVYVYQYLLTK